MKIGLVTLYGNTNYGNRLQNYAVQEILRERGFETETLVCKNSTPKVLLRKVYHTIMAPLGNKKSKRMAVFSRFNRAMIHTRIIRRKNESLPCDLASKYDFFVTGSDQVWNPDIRLNEKDLFFLRFARKEQRICLSPSIAVNEIPPTCMTEYRIGLNGFPNLSCREAAGSALITRITGKNCVNTIDPTLAINAQTWRAFSKPVPQKKPYILLFFLGTVPDKVRQLVQMEAKKRNLEIVELSSVNDKHYVSNPQNFVWLFDHAELILTDSFHGTAFSINLNKPFYAFNRLSDKSIENRMVSRITSLTEKFGLSDRYIKNDVNELNFSCNFEYANAVLKSERKIFYAYLDQCLEQKKNPPNLLPDHRCTGCGLCEKVCPRNCITMKQDAEGFLRPEIDHYQCASCKQCTNKCPVLQTKELVSNELQQVFAAVYNRQEKLRRSSSGAIFPLMAEWTIRQNGVVFGAAFTKRFEVEHDWAESENSVERFYTSKYVQSNIALCYSKVEELLKSGRTVLFSGTPCQLAAIRNYLGKDYERLILVECACHGVPSPKVWEAYKSYLSTVHLHGEPICHVNFREKIDGHLFFIKACSMNYTYIRYNREDAYFNGFLNNMTLRPSCVECDFKGTKRVADITLADFWGIGKVCPAFPRQEGVSMVMINSLKGKKLWDAVACEDVCSQEVCKERVVGKVNSAIWKSVSEHSKRREFFGSYGMMDIEKALTYYCVPAKVPFIKKVLRKLKRMLT